jgi:hypothetical protein
VHSIRWVSPFFWAVGDDQLTHGVSAAAWAALLGVGLVLVGAAAIAFRRLDITEPLGRRHTRRGALTRRHSALRLRTDPWWGLSRSVVFRSTVCWVCSAGI